MSLLIWHLPTIVWSTPGLLGCRSGHFPVQNRHVLWTWPVKLLQFRKNMDSSIPGSTNQFWTIYPIIWAPWNLHFSQLNHYFVTVTFGCEKSELSWPLCASGSSDQRICCRPSWADFGFRTQGLGSGEWSISLSKHLLRRCLTSLNHTPNYPKHFLRTYLDP